MSWQVDVPWLSKIGWPISFSSGGELNYVYQLDGTTQLYSLSGKIVDVDQPFEIEWYHDGTLSFSTIIAQNISTTQANIELQIYATSTTFPTLSVIVGGALISRGNILTQPGYYSVYVGGGKLIIKRDGVQIDAPNFTSGVAREPAATTTIGAQRNGSVNSYTRYRGAVHKDVKVWTGGDRTTGTLTTELPLTNRVQGAVQQPTTGAITATIINYTDGGWIQQ